MKIGTKIGYFSNLDYDSRIAPYVDFFEVSIIDDFNYKYIKKLNKEVVIHAAHQGEGVNLADPNVNDYNIKQLNAARKAADFFNSKKIIIHPGLITNKNCNLENTLDTILKNFDYRYLIENMPKTKSDDRHLGVSPEEMENILSYTNLNFCFDFSHALEYAEFCDLNKRSLLDNFINLNPSHFHCTDTDLREVHLPKTTKCSHLNLGDGTVDFDQLKSYFLNKTPITLETPRLLKKQIHDIKKLRALTT